MDDDDKVKKDTGWARLEALAWAVKKPNGHGPQTAQEIVEDAKVFFEFLTT